MNCQKCNFQNEDTAKFCRNCGVELGIEQKQIGIAPQKNHNKLWKTLAIVFPAIIFLYSLFGMIDTSRALDKIRDYENNKEKMGMEMSGVESYQIASNFSMFGWRVPILDIDLYPVHYWRVYLKTEGYGLNLRGEVRQQREVYFYIMIISGCQLGILLLLVFGFRFNQKIQKQNATKTKY